MNRIYKSSLVVALLLLPFGFSASASAASTCAVGYTGPDSNNLCTSTTTYACTVNNDTEIDVTGQNIQIAVSGDASGGTASTGSTTNANGTTFTATVTNGTCVAVATVPATTTTPVVPQTPTPAVVAPQKASVATLPNTDGQSPLVSAGIIAASLGAGAIVVRLGMSLYSRMKS